MTQDSQPDQTDELLGRMDALLGRHRPAEAPADDDDIPVLTEVVIETADEDEIPVLQDLAPEFDSAAAFAEVDDFDIPVLEEALPDSLADVTAFAEDSDDSGDLPEIVLEMEQPAPRRPELLLLEDAPDEIMLEVAAPEQELTLGEAPPVIATPVVAVCPPEVLAEEAVAVPAVTHQQVAAVVDEILGDVASGLDARVASIVRRHFAITLAQLYRDSLQQAMQAAMAEIRQDLRSTVEQVVTEQLVRRDL